MFLTADRQRLWRKGVSRVTIRDDIRRLRTHAPPGANRIHSCVPGRRRFNLSSHKIFQNIQRLTLVVTQVAALQGLRLAVM